MMVFFLNKAGENFNLAKIFLNVRVRLEYVKTFRVNRKKRFLKAYQFLEIL